MSENRSVMERAIESAETVLENAKWYAEISGARENMRRKKRGKIDIAELTLKALREKVEREKGCECCLQGEDMAYGHDTLKRTGRIYLDGNLLTADLYSDSMAVAICYCPMCGRRLEAENG